MKRLNLLLTLVILIFNINAYSQDNYIIAGQHDTSSSYYDFVPDTIVPSNQNIQLDLNNDGVYDFKIYTFSDFSSHYSATGTGIYAENNNLVALGRVDTQYGYYGEESRNVAKIFEYGDTINDSSGFVHQAYMVLYSSALGSPDFNISDWLNKGDKYLGFKLFFDDTLSYGWIRINVLRPDSVVIKDYAFNIKTNVGVQDIYSENNLKIYPNPANNYVKVDVSCSKSVSKVEIVDLTGKAIFIDESFNDNIIDVSSFRKGMYLIKITFYNNKIMFKKFIKI